MAAIEGDVFEHYLPDMKPVVEMKTQAVDNFMTGAIAFGRARKAARQG